MIDSYVDVLYDLEAGETVVLRYDSSYGGIQAVSGTVRGTPGSAYRRIETRDGQYLVYGSGVKERSKGDVAKQTDGSRRKVGTFLNAERVPDQ